MGLSRMALSVRKFIKIHPAALNLKQADIHDLLYMRSHRVKNTYI
jgi:hypothetical protein